MFGSRREPNLTWDRKIVLALHPTTGMPLSEAMRQLTEFLDAYHGDKSALMFGYFEYGDEIVVTEPEPPKES